ncbi:MAG TPA: MBL fold metallo-hydrolase [Acetobacteraceae bacterium]|jgi:glyoxylase-like metal-dependent hydrolase (beta-lactamase superfamily II)
MTLPSRPDRQPAGVHHLRVGDVVVTALNDGQFEGGFDWLVGVEAAEATKLHQASFRAVPPRVTVNAFLVHLPDRLVLVDAGCGGAMGPDMGRLAANLTAAGIAPSDVDVVLATHLHPDHVGGLVDGDGRAVFPNAELVVHEAEPRFWGDETVLANASEQNRGFVMLARATMAAYGNRMRQVTEGEVLPGVTVVPEPGHTPGHSGWLVASGGDSLLIWGDVVHLPGVQFARPEAEIGFDIDGAQAIASRQRIMDMAATDRLLVAGMHLDFPAFGHVARAAQGYAFVPEVWRPGV